MGCTEQEVLAETRSCSHLLLHFGTWSTSGFACRGHVVVSGAWVTCLKLDS